MNTRLKIWLIALLVLAGQSLAIGIAAAHDADPAHGAHDCAVCVTVQINDTAPPPADYGFDVPPVSYWVVGDVQTQEAVLKSPSGTIKARAPPA